MQYKTWPSLWTLLLVALCMNVVVAGHIRPVYARQDEETTSTSPSSTPTDSSTTVTSTPPPESSTASGDATSTTATATSSHTTSTTTTPMPTTTGNSATNDTVYAPQIPPGQLPLQPELTPGWGVAGAILLLSGGVYALIGIKNAWLQTFFSAAYLAALCTSVLILYVMVVPVSDAIQGAYVVAAVCAGAIIGGGATLFRELTEGFGCLLGGFCLAMWLLTLKSGGLLTESTDKIIFIAVFTVVGYALYFSHWTRGYAMIGLISFAGATVAVLGIDCFSTAGLKEFWAYIWDLNGQLFPLGTNTYPQTKGITVEIALTVIFAGVGIISQIKLWRVIEERRSKRAGELEEEQRQRDAEEAQIGQQIEGENKRDRKAWEAAYGNGEMPPDCSVAGSSFGEGDNEKNKFRNSQTTTVRRTSGEEDKDIEMDNLGPSESTEPLKHKSEVLGTGEDGRVTVRVARDDDAPSEDNDQLPTIHEPPQERIWIVGADGKPRPAEPRIDSRRQSGQSSRAPGPQLVPLPFRVPQSQDDDKEKKSDDAADDDDDDGSLAATFADEDERSAPALSRAGSKASLGRRLSVNGGKLLRSLSGRSMRSLKTKRMSEVEPPLPSPGLASTGLPSPGLPSPGLASSGFPSPGLPPSDGKNHWGDSREDLVGAVPAGDARSVAATLDDMSTEGSYLHRNNSSRRNSTWTKDINAELAHRSTTTRPSSSVIDPTEKPPSDRFLKPKLSTTHLEVQTQQHQQPTSPTSVTSPISMKDPIPELKEEESKEEGTKEEFKLAPPGAFASKRSSVNTASNTKDDGLSTSENGPKMDKSVTPSVTSTAPSLTKERLPPSLSRVALSYRTNEWAKHLSRADTPEPENLELYEYAQLIDDKPMKKTSAVDNSVEKPTEKPLERAAPVNVEQLQQTADSGIPPASSVPSVPAASAVPQSNLRLSISSGSIPLAPASNTPALAALNGTGQLTQSPTEMTPSQPLPQPSSSHSFRNKAAVGSRRGSSELSSRPIAEESHGENQHVAGATAIQSPSSPSPEQQPTAALRPTSGIVSFASPQTLLGQRELFLRHKSNPMLAGPPTIPEVSEYGSNAGSRPASEVNGVAPYRMSHSPSMPLIYQAHNPEQDADDMPLSQRRNLMRHSSTMSMGSNHPYQNHTPQRSSSAMSSFQPRTGSQTPTSPPQANADGTAFNSHQPQRQSSVMSSAAREAQLASFRQSVQADLRSSPHGIPLSTSIAHGSLSSPDAGGPTNPTSTGGAGGRGLIGNLNLAQPGGSSINLLGSNNNGRNTPQGLQQPGATDRMAIDQSRNKLMSQKEYEVQRRESDRLEKERNERAFEEMMRRGDLMDAHREAMRKMQKQSR